jgi:hypothetical protein
VPLQGTGHRRWTLIAALLAGTTACKAKGAAADASVNADDAAAFTTNLPETVVIYLDAGAEPGRPAPASTKSGKVELISGLPAPCEDTTKRLGLVTFTQVDDDVVITSSKTKARARCKVKDSQTLICDWLGMDGKPSVFHKPVTYGPKKPIVGAFDKTHSFRCAPQP